MRRTLLVSFVVVVGGLMALGVAGSDKAKPEPTAKAKTAAAPKAEPKVFAGKKGEKEIEAAIRQSADAFLAAYNKHDAKTCAAGFTATAEFVTENGMSIRGRDAIERHFAAVFTEFPKANLKLHVDAVKLITSTVAVEEGNVEFEGSWGRNIEASRYVAVHVLEDGQWRLARVRDYSSEAEVRSNYEHLRELEFLVGEWMQEDEASMVATSCQWVDRKNYMLQEIK